MIAPSRLRHKPIVNVLLGSDMARKSRLREAMMRYLDITSVQRTFYHASLKIEKGSSELPDFDAHLLNIYRQKESLL